MRITFVIPQLTIGGGVKSTLELANRLQDKGHEVTVVYPWTRLLSGSKWYNFKTLVPRALEFIRDIRGGDSLPGREGDLTEGRFRNPAGKIIKGLRRLGNESRLDWFDLRANLMRVPTLAERYIPRGDVIIATWWANAHEINGYGADRGEKFYFIRHYEIWGGPRELVDKTYTLPLHKLVTSTWLKNLIEDRFNVHTFGPLPNGVDFGLFYREREGFACHSPKRVGILYRRQTWKGMEDGLKAFLIAKNRFQDIKLVLFGVKITPDDMKIVGTIDKVEYHRLPTGGALREIYNSLDIFLFPSHCEGFGNPPMEAMACGVACVTTDVGAVRDYAIPGETALVSPPGDAESLSRHLISLLADEGKRRRIAEDGHKHIQEFTWGRTTDRLEEIFKEICRR